jgi:hypothetical protein
MRGDDQRPDTMFSDVAPEQRVPADHPLGAIRTMVDTALRELSPQFARLYPKTSPVDPAREAAPRLAGADAVLGPERAPAHGVAGLQPLSAGSWASAWMIRPCSPRTGSGCSAGTSPGRSSSGCWTRPRGASSSRPSTLHGRRDARRAHGAHGSVEAIRTDPGGASRWA